MVQLSQTMRLEQRLSPQQILLSTLLQLPLLSLEQKIQTELELNPVLEEGLEEQLDTDADEITASQDEIDEVAGELELTENSNPSDLDVKELEKAQEDTDWETMLNDEESYEIRLPKDKNEEDYERPEVGVISMTEHLLEQLNYLTLTDQEQEIGEYLIWNIRDDGYLDENLTVENVASVFQAAVETVERILQKIHHFDPVGIGARDLRECLLVQLMDDDYSTEMARVIIREHFEDFKNKRFEKIIDAMDVDREDFREALLEISKLNPKPGEGMHNGGNNYVVPDFIVEKQDGDFIVSLNDWNIPPLRISKTYKQMLLDKKHTDKDTKQYIRKKMESAKWFINSIYQRKITMMKVMEAIVERQQDFFSKGPAHINPLIQREIAEMISMDISTVSRVANGKYVQTDFGVFELKYFFNEKIETDDGEEISTRKVKERIRQLVEVEDPKKPLSDDKLSQVLNKEGFPVARRTVAKYREQLNIPVARLRRNI
jgi:RNA polymerase sigma-54 factor